MARKWTQDMIESNILETMKVLGISRMPTRSEIILVVGNPTACKITKTLGYYGWANKLGIPIKESESTTGRNGELYAKSVLEENGFCVEKMPTKYAFDLLVEGDVRIDVKTANLYHGKNGNFYSFATNKTVPVCDVYILIANDLPKKRLFVVPSYLVKQTQISIGERNSIYHKYEDRFDIIRAYHNSLDGLREQINKTI